MDFKWACTWSRRKLEKSSPKEGSVGHDRSDSTGMCHGHARDGQPTTTVRVVIRAATTVAEF